MFKPERRKRTIFLSAVGFVVAVTSGVVIWSTVAGADTRSEPAASASRRTLKSKAVSKLAAESSYSSIRGKELRGGRGQIKGKIIPIGGGDDVWTSPGSVDTGTVRRLAVFD